MICFLYIDDWYFLPKRNIVVGGKWDELTLLAALAYLGATDLIILVDTLIPNLV